MRKRYETVIYDLDGTLLNTLEDLANAVNHALRESGYPERTLEEVCRFVGNGVGQLIHRALPASADGDEEAFQETLQAFKSYYARHNNDTTAPYDGCIRRACGRLSFPTRTTPTSRRLRATTSAAGFRWRWGSRRACAASPRRIRSSR